MSFQFRNDWIESLSIRIRPFQRSCHRWSWRLDFFRKSRNFLIVTFSINRWRNILLVMLKAASRLQILPVNLWSQNLWNLSWCVMQRKINEDLLFLTWWWVECLTNKWQIHWVYIPEMGSNRFCCATPILFGGNHRAIHSNLGGESSTGGFCSKLEHQLWGGAFWVSIEVGSW